MQPIPQIALAHLTGNSHQDLVNNILTFYSRAGVRGIKRKQVRKALKETFPLYDRSNIQKIKNSLLENQKKFFYSLLKPNERQDYFPLSGNLAQSFINKLFEQKYPIYYHFQGSSDAVQEAFAQAATPEKLFPIFADEQYSSINRLKAAIFYQQQINDDNNNIYNTNKDLAGFKAAALQALTDIYYEREESIFYRMFNFITVIRNNFLYKKLIEIFSRIKEQLSKLLGRITSTEWFKAIASSAFIIKTKEILDKIAQTKSYIAIKDFTVGVFHKLYDLILPSKITDKELLEKILAQNKQSIIKKITKADRNPLITPAEIAAEDPKNFRLENFTIRTGIPIALIIAIFLTPSHIVAVPLFSVIGLYLCITTQTRYEARERQGAPEKFAAKKAIKALNR